MAARPLPAVAIFGLLALLPTGCDWGPGTRIREPVLSGAEILGRVRGGRFEGRTEAGGQIVVRYHRDGRAGIEGRTRAGVTFADTGWWSIEGDRLCTRYERVRGGAKICEWVTETAGVFRTFDPAGHPTARGRFDGAAPTETAR